MNTKNCRDNISFKSYFRSLLNCLVIFCLLINNNLSAANSGQSVIGQNDGTKLPSFIKIPSTWENIDPIFEGERINLLGNTYFGRLYTNKYDPRVNIDGEHLIPVVTKIDSITHEEKPITDPNELRALQLYILADHHGFNPSIRDYLTLSNYYKDLAEKMDPNTFDGWLFLLEVDKFLLAVGLGVIFPNGAPATITVIGNILSAGAAYWNFVSSLSNRDAAIDGENLYARCINAAKLVREADFPVIEQAFVDAGFNGVNEYLAIKYWAGVTSGVDKLYSISDILRSFHNGFGYEVIKNADGKLIAKGVYNPNDLITSASLFAVKLIIDYAVPVDFNTALKSMMMSNHLHATVGEALTNTIIEDKEKIYQTTNAEELENLINLVIYEDISLSANYSEFLHLYQYYLQKAKDAPVQGLLFVSQSQINQLGDLAKDAENTVSIKIKTLEKVNSDLNFAIKSGYPDYTSGFFYRIAEFGVSPQQASYVDTFTF